MKKILYTVVFTIIFVLGALFAVSNAQPVKVVWLGNLYSEQPLALVLALTLALGVALGWLVATMRHVFSRRANQERTGGVLEKNITPNTTPSKKHPSAVQSTDKNISDATTTDPSLLR